MTTTIRRMVVTIRKRDFDAIRLCGHGHDTDGRKHRLNGSLKQGPIMAVYSQTLNRWLCEDEWRWEWA